MELEPLNSIIRGLLEKWEWKTYHSDFVQISSSAFSSMFSLTASAPAARTLPF